LDNLNILGKEYKQDEWTNVTPSILNHLSRRLHLQENHPISITRQLIESRFPGYKTYNTLSPVVSVEQNFDSLDFPLDHPGRSRTDTYYVNRNTVLRTHTSAHEADIFRANLSNGYLISADVYRRDAIDKSHYPAFHQMEGAYTWEKSNGDASKMPPITQGIWKSLDSFPQHDLEVLDPDPPFHPERNPLQALHHTPEEAEAIGAHLKRSLEHVVVEIFAQARKARQAAGLSVDEDMLKVRWVEAYFPWTSPSWELEVWWNGDWLEVLGCGIIKQDLLINADVPSRIGWAFGIGLERIAMLLFSVPDIRLFWSQDSRFLSQFSSPFAFDPESTTATVAPATVSINYFQPYSKYPSARRDVSFWLPNAPSVSAAGEALPPVELHENDFMEIVREVAGDSAEDVHLIDSFTHPKTGRRSTAYRIVYRSFDRTLTSQEISDMHDLIVSTVKERHGVEIR
jgi:phenylalanyl-tRNA synthetase alpha chain